MSLKIKHHISMKSEDVRALRILAAQHGLRQGEAVAGLLALASTRPLLEVARAMAAADNQEGELVWEGTETAYIAQVRALAAVPARGEEF